jgi:hypothetical protein
MCAPAPHTQTHTHTSRFLSASNRKYQAHLLLFLCVPIFLGVHGVLLVLHMSSGTHSRSVGRLVTARRERILLEIVTPGGRVRGIYGEVLGNVSRLWENSLCIY